LVPVGQWIIARESEDYADPVILVVGRQRRRPDPGGLLDAQRFPGIWFEFVVRQVVVFAVQAIPFTSLLVDGMESREGRPGPGNDVESLVLLGSRLLDRANPAADGNVREVRTLRTRAPCAMTRAARSASRCHRMALRNQQRTAVIHL
jgi:hypothetical protein